MLSTRLVRLIESHAEELAKGLVSHLKSHPRTPSLHHFSEDQLRDRALSVYGHLGDWLSGEHQEDIRKTYEEFGARRAAEGIPLSEMLYGLAVTKNHLLEFAWTSMEGSSSMEVLGTCDLIFKVSRLFDNAAYCTAVGYEHHARHGKQHVA